MKVHRFREIRLEIDLTCKVSPKCMSANEDSDSTCVQCPCFGLFRNEKLPVCQTFFFLQKNGLWSWAGHFFVVSKFLYLVTSMHCLNDDKEADILDRLGLPLNGGYTWGV